jgi:hypothetical protein
VEDLPSIATVPANIGAISTDVAVATVEPQIRQAQTAPNMRDFFMVNSP